MSHSRLWPESERERALCAKKTCGHENGIRHMISGVGDKLREFYWRPVIGDVVVWERGGRNPVRSVIPATLIYLGASPDRDGGGRWIKRARRNGRNSSQRRLFLPLLSKKFRTSDHCSLWGSKVPNWGTALIAHSGALFSSSCVSNFRVHFASSFSPRAPTRIVSSSDSMNCK